MQTESTNSQAWRKKPRRFAPKSRKGCKTCKIRRIKCDQTRPSCSKCQSTGRICDGYNDDLSGDSRFESSLSHSSGGEADRTRNSGNNSQSASRDSGIEREHWQSGLEAHQDPALQRVFPSLTVLSVSGPTQAESLRFFEDISIKHLNKYQPLNESWHKTLMLFSQTVPAVRYAAIALGLLHRNHILDCTSGSSDRVYIYQPPSLRGQSQLNREAPLFYYTRAIQLLLDQNGIGQDTIEKRAITLLAMKHVTGGVQLSRSLVKAMLSDENKPSNNSATSSDIHTLVSQVESQIRRLDLQALMFIMDWKPDEMHVSDLYQPPSSAYCFQSIDEARYHMEMTIAQVMRLRNTESGMLPTGKITSTISPPPYKQVLLGQMANWLRLFENMLPLQELKPSSSRIDSETIALVDLLRLQHSIAWIFLSSYGPDKEMEYDAFLPQFQQCIVLADKVALAHQRYNGSSRPTFTPEIGILPMLYIIGAKCRHPTIRREAVRILRRQPIQEAAWNSVYTARALDRVIDIEEAVINTDGAATSMSQIAVGQRIEAMTWLRVFAGNSERISTFIRSNRTHFAYNMLHSHGSGGSSTTLDMILSRVGLTASIQADGFLATDTWNQTAVNKYNQTVMLERILAHLFADALPREGSLAVLLNTSQSVDSSTLKNYLQSSDYQSRLLNGDSPLLPPDNAPFVSRTATITISGLGYKASEFIDFAAIALLLAYLLVVITRTSTLIITRRTSDGWDSITEFFTLLHNSPPAQKFLKNTGAGIGAIQTYTYSVRIYAIKAYDTASKELRVEAYFVEDVHGSDDEKIMLLSPRPTKTLSEWNSSTEIQVGRRYGETIKIDLLYE